MKKENLNLMIIFTCILVLGSILIYVYLNFLMPFPDKNRDAAFQEESVLSQTNDSKMASANKQKIEDHISTKDLRQVTEATASQTEKESVEQITEVPIETPTDVSENTEEQPELDYKYIALTFDDGPYEPVNQRILDLLDQYDGHATFFMLGSRVSNYPELLQRIVHQGSEIGNHSYSHADFTTLNIDQVYEELNATNQAIRDACGYEVFLYRPPYGALNTDLLNQIDLPAILWNVDTLDWQSQDPDSIAEYIMSAESGSIILMHSLYSTTADALEKAIPALYEQGYRFVTVSELFNIYGMSLISNHSYSSPF